MNRSSVISFVSFGCVVGNLRNCNITGFYKVTSKVCTGSAILFPKSIFFSRLEVVVYKITGI